MDTSSSGWLTILYFCKIPNARYQATVRDQTQESGSATTYLSSRPQIFPLKVKAFWMYVCFIYLTSHPIMFTKGLYGTELHTVYLVKPRLYKFYDTDALNSKILPNNYIGNQILQPFYNYITKDE